VPTSTSGELTIVAERQIRTGSVSSTVSEPATLALIAEIEYSWCKFPNTDFASTNASAARPPSRLSRSRSDASQEEAMVEATIRQRVEDWAKAISAKDIDGVMSLYSPNIISFDIVPPLRYSGAEGKRRAWQEAFDGYAGPIAYEVRDLAVTAHAELAFVHSVNHVKGVLASGRLSDLWLRWTACFRRIDGIWLVVHDHASEPADLEHGRAVVNLTP